MTAAASRLPNEVWGEILKNVPDTDPPDKSAFKSFSLTCSAFCGISRSHLFSRIDFTSYIIGDNGAPLLPSPSEVDRRIQRLDFLCSTEIAPFVRECHILGQHPSRYWSQWTFSTDAPYILLDALFERLVRFTGLQMLYPCRISLTQPRLDILLRLQHISKLCIVYCTVVPKQHIPLPPAVHLSEFHLWDRTDYWIPLLDPDYLRVLSVTLDSDSIRRAVQTIPTLPNVHRLSASSNNMTSSQSLTFLSKFPGLRILSLWHYGSAIDIDVVVEMEAMFPHLQEYYGCCQALSLFRGSTALRRMQTNLASPQDFLIRIQAIQGLTITSLHATFTMLDNAVFNEIVKFLPQLTELLLIISVEDISTLFEHEIYGDGELPGNEVLDGKCGDYVRSGFTVSTFFLELSNVPALPPGLERLAISWEFNEDEFSEQYSSYEIPDFADNLDTLVAKMPRSRMDLAQWHLLHVRMAAHA
ncbi:L-aminoadipate-semialdehyde dehydrogenase [Mycena sanguinolenta]|uniref:L-aminoadipate-semialdehyde dehydrogenase n=1 Tax=Mycena sanguinolenta TaxID=230812 RepID=A0A8H7D3N8_9AGAR|nr:L-aminoadipate-semialdehyde dehydrogenase [Mycena sanguinolenta]